MGEPLREDPGYDEADGRAHDDHEDQREKGGQEERALPEREDRRRYEEEPEVPQQSIRPGRHGGERDKARGEERCEEKSAQNSSGDREREPPLERTRAEEDGGAQNDPERLAEERTRARAQAGPPAASRSRNVRIPRSRRVTSA